MRLFHKEKSFNVEFKAISLFSKYTGLMFKTKETENLLFKFKNYKTFGIHSFFVFFVFLAIWLDENNKIVDYSIIRPFTFLVKSKYPSVKLLELPLNNRNKRIIEFLVGKRKI